MRLGGGGVSPSVEARNFTDRGGLLPCPTWGHSLATVLMLGVLWSGLAACMLGALSYDIAYWFGVRETHSQNSMIIASHCNRANTKSGSVANAVRHRSARGLNTRARVSRSRSTCAFCQGDLGEIGRSLIPTVRIRLVKAGPRRHRYRAPNRSALCLCSKGPVPVEATTTDPAATDC
jgi:hypothetical protein